MHTHTYIHTYIHTQLLEWIVGRVFANGQGDRGSITGRVISKTQKIIVDAALPNSAF